MSLHLIVTNAGDAHADVVAAELTRRRVRCLRFHTEDFPQRIGLTIASSGDEHRIESLVDGRRDNLDHVTSVWWRRPTAPRIVGVDDSLVERTACADATDTLGCLWRLLRDRFWVNPFEHELRARNKPWQLRMAREVGLDIPRTLITNDDREVLAFVNDCGGRVVYKTFAPVVRDAASGGRTGIYTTLLNAADVSKRLDAIRCAPCLLQEYVEKKAEYRATVIGRSIFVAEIRSRDGRPFRGDCRKDLSQMTCRPAEMPLPTVARVHALMEGMGLVFGCLDFIRTPDDRWIFLEINSSGQWYGIELLTGMPLLAAFTDMLTRGSGLRRIA